MATNGQTWLNICPHGHSKDKFDSPVDKFVHTYVHVEVYTTLVVIPTAPCKLTKLLQARQKEDQELCTQTSSTGRTTFQHYLKEYEFQAYI